jgi:hypothetical protein
MFSMEQNSVFCRFLPPSKNSSLRRRGVAIFCRDENLPAWLFGASIAGDGHAKETVMAASQIVAPRPGLFGRKNIHV